MSKIIPLQFEQVDMAPIDALGLIRINLKDIDERTDKILEITHSVAIEHEIDKIWDSVEDLAYTAMREMELLRKQERTCRDTSDSNYFRCSECQKKTYRGEETFNYCPSCGAKVVGK